MLIHHTRQIALAFVVFLLLTVAQTWPLASAPAHWSRIDGDGGINTWAVSWVAHAILTDPSRLFDANIFHPEVHTLAYSEAMLVQSLFAVPVIALGGSAVLAYSVSVLAGFALTGWAFCLLAWRWTGSWTAGYVAGSLAAFNAYTLVNFTHLQFLHTGFIAVMLFALDRLITSPRTRDAVWLAVAFALQAMASIYLMVFSTFTLAFALLGRTREWARRAMPLLRHLAIAAVVAAVILAPYLAQYWRVNQTMHFERSAADASAADWHNYLSTASNIHYTRWSKDFGGGMSAFPGFIALALAVVALVDPTQRRDPRVRMCAVAAAGCVAMSFAPKLPFYDLLYRVIPLLHMVRAVHLIAQLALLMIAVLAGFGAAALLRRAEPASPKRLREGGAVGGRIGAVLLVALVNGEALRAPVGFNWFEGVPAVYDVLAKSPGAVVVEAPFPIPQQWFLNAPYMVNSTRHWRPMLNGYSGFLPPSYDRSYQAMATFPSDASLIALSQLGVTHIVVHQRAMNHGAPDTPFNPYESIGSLNLVTRDDDVLIYQLLRR